MGRRVVVTGLGLICGVGNSTDEVWKALLAGKSGVARITGFDASAFACQIAAEVKNFDPLKYIEKKEVKKMGRFIHLALAAADEAMKMSGLKITPENDERVGVHIGSGIGGFDIIEREHTSLLEGGPRKISPFFIPAAIINLAAGQVSMRFGAKGPNEATATACTTSAHSIGDSFRIIQHNDADVMIAGGAEAAITPMGVGGFAAMRALSTRNDDPEKASRPWDQGRDGFVIGEGSGILILEELEFARKRGAPILAEIAGYGMSGDAYHMTQPAPEHEGGFRVMRNAVRDAKVEPSVVGLRERARHVHADRRHARSSCHPQFLRRAQTRREFHQVDDRTSAGRRRRTRSRHHGARSARPDPASDHQSGESRSRYCRHGSGPQPRPQSRDSNTPCRTPSASAEPMARCCSVAGRNNLSSSFPKSRVPHPCRVFCDRVGNLNSLL